VDRLSQRIAPLEADVANAGSQAVWGEESLTPDTLAPERGTADLGASACSKRVVGRSV